VKTLAEKMKVWSIRLRYLSYASGFAGVIMMLVARGSSEPARSMWSQRSFIFLGLMMAGFITYYMLNVLRIYRK
jgi:hypothetical protein